MESPKRVKIKLRDISLVPQIQRSRRKRRLVGPIGSRKPIQVETTRQLTATLAVIIILKLTLLATISLRPNHNGNFFLLANCHNFKSPGSLEPRDAQEMLSSHQKHQQQAKDDDDDNALERLIGLMTLNFSHERRPSRRRSGMNSNAQRLSESFKKPHAAATSKHLRKLLARPRQVLSSFVPQILSKQIVLKRPHATGQLSKLPREVQSDKRYQNQTALHMSHRHLDTDPGARDHPVVQHARPPASPEFLQIARPPPLPPFISIPISQYSNVQLQNQQQQRPEPGEEPAASSDEEQSAGSASDDGLASEAERGLSQIDQLIKREFETRSNLNERADEWQRQREMANNGGGGGGGNGKSSDTTLANPLNRAAAGEPTAAPHAVFLSWPPRIHRDEPRRRPAADDERDNRDEWRPTDFPPSLLTAAPLPPTAGTRKSRDSARGNAGARRGPTAEIVLGRPDAMRLPPPPSQLPPTTTTTTTASANDALSAFVPSALETIAQLKLNQTGGSQPLVMPSNVPTIPTTTNVHKSHPLPSLDQQQQQQQHISLLNGRPAFGGEQHAHLLPAGGHQLAHSQPAHIRAHHRAVNYLRNSHEPLVNWHIRDEQMSSDLRETLSRLRATKAKIRQLQAELENATPPGLFAAETNKTITRYVDQLNTSQTSEQAKRASQEAAAAATSGRGGLEWFRSWSPPFNRTGGGGGPAVRAQQSMNVPLGLYYGAGPLATPARLVASALGRTVQHSIGGGPGSLAGIVSAPQPQPTAFSLRPTKIWSATLANPGGDIQSPSQQANAADLMSVRPSSAPILLSSTLRVATGVSEQSTTTTTTTVKPSLANRTATNRTMTAGSVPAGPADNPAGTRWQDQSSHRVPLGSKSSSQPADVPLSALRIDNRTLTSGGESDEAASEEDDNDDESGDERPPSTDNNINNGRRWPAAEGHQQRAQESTPLGVVGAPVRPAPQIPPTSLSAATAVDHHQRQQDEPLPPPPVPKQQHYQAPHKDGDDKRASPLNPKPAATESPIVIVDAPSASVHQAGGVLHVLTPPPPPPPLVGLTTRKPGRAKPSARVPIIPAVAAAGESDRSQASLNLNASTSQAFDDFTSEPPARSVPPPNGPASDNFFARLIGDFGNLLFRASGTSANTSDQMIGPIKIGPIDVQSQSPFQVARSLNSRAPFDSSAGNQRQQQVVAVAKLTTERLARNLIVIVSALSLVSLVAVLLFVRLQQARRTRRQNFSDPRCQLNPAAASSQSRSSGADGSDPSSLQDDSLFFDAHQQQHRCSGWRRLGPINFISQASSKGQQDKIILDGTMRNVSLLAKHRQHRPSQQPTMRTADDVPRPLMNRSCCHCVSCSESWLFRDSQQQQQRQHGLARDTPLCSSGFYHPAPRGKLPFGAASSVNNMLQRSASNRSLQVVRQDQKQKQGQVAAVGRDDKQQGNQRAPIGGTRLRMMSAIDESGADRSSSTASDASEWQARMLLNGDCSDEFNDASNCQPLTSACDNCDHNHQQQHQRARHYQQHQRWHNLGCCPGCNGHLLTPTGQESDQQQQQSSDGALPLESDGASFIVLNGHQHRFSAHNQQQDEMTSAAAAPRDSSARIGDSQQIESAQADKNENARCRTRAGSSGSSSGNGIRNKSSECHDKRPMGNCGHRQTIATDEIHNCSRCCDNVSISNHHHHHLASAAASVAAAATGKKITTPNTIAAK